MANTGLIWYASQKSQTLEQAQQSQNNTQTRKSKCGSGEMNVVFTFPFKLLADAHFKAFHRKSNSGLK